MPFIVPNIAHFNCLLRFLPLASLVLLCSLSSWSLFARIDHNDDFDGILGGLEVEGGRHPRQEIGAVIIINN